MDDGLVQKSKSSLINQLLQVHFMWYIINRLYCLSDRSLCTCTVRDVSILKVKEIKWLSNRISCSSSVLTSFRLILFPVIPIEPQAYENCREIFDLRPACVFLTWVVLCLCSQERPCSALWWCVDLMALSFWSPWSCAYLTVRLWPLMVGLLL